MGEWKKNEVKWTHWILLLVCRVFLWLQGHQSLYVFIDTYKLDRRKTHESLSSPRFVSRQKGKEFSPHKKKNAQEAKTKERSSEGLLHNHTVSNTVWTHAYVWIFTVSVCVCVLTVGFLPSFNTVFLFKTPCTVTAPGYRWTASSSDSAELQQDKHRTLYTKTQNTPTEADQGRIKLQRN